MVVTAIFHAFDDQLLVSDKMHSDWAGRHADEDEDEKEPAMEMSAVSLVGDAEEEADEDALLSATVRHSVVKGAAIPLTREEAQWIDVWLFARDYSLQMREENHKDGVFPMLLLQLA